MPFNAEETPVVMREFTSVYFDASSAVSVALSLLSGPKITHIGAKRTLFVGKGAWGCVERTEDGLLVTISFPSDSNMDTKRLVALGFEEG